MKIYEWNSYSCNNSSDIRLVAKFTNTKKAQQMLNELELFFEEHATEHDEKLKEGIFEYPGGVTDIAKKFGEKYKHVWDGFIIWGDEGLKGNAPTAIVLDDTLVLYHSYTGGFGTDLESVLKNAGAKSIEEENGVPTIYVSFDIQPKKGSDFIEELTTFFDQRFDNEDIESWDPTPGSEYAWGEGNGLVEDTSFLVDEKKCYYTFPLRPCYIEIHKTFLQGKKVTGLDMRIATDEDIIDLQERAEAQLESLEGSDHDVFDPVGLSFLFTGKLASLTRKDAQNRVNEIGGENAKSVTKTLDVLVIGDEGSPLYGQGNIGSKQRKANKLNDDGAEIWVITETLFLQLK